MIIKSRSVKETQKIAAGLAKKIISLRLSSAVVIALEGELGAGKTVFVKALANSLGVKDKIKSPTFVLMRKYTITKTGNRKTCPELLEGPETGNYLYHLDCYRLRDEKDLGILGIGNIFKELHNIVAIEWSDRVRKILPKKHIQVHINHIDATTRKIAIKQL